MKDRKLRVRVTGIPRDFYLFKPKGERAWCVKFFPPSAVRIVLGKKRLFHSTGTTEVEPARDIAARFIKRHWDMEKLEANGVIKRRKTATLDDIIAMYEPPPQFVSAATRTKNVSSLKLLVRQGASVDDPGKATTTVLTAETIKRFQRLRLAAAGAKDMVEQERAAVTINATVRQARSVFARDRMHLYEGLGLLPESLREFMAVPLLKVDQDMSFVPFPPGTIERLEAELPKQSRNVRLTTMLMLYLGLRNKEVEFAKWEWFRELPDKSGVLAIERRPYFKVKNRSVRTIHLDRELMAQLVKFRDGYGDDDWVIDEAHDTLAEGGAVRDFNSDRYEITHYEINVWLRPIIPNRTKCAYELRKHAGSVVLTRPESEGGGLAAAARFLGDSIAITEKHYARFLKPVHAVRSAELRPHMVNAAAA